MAGYSGTPLWKKLGYKTGMSAYVDGRPKNYRSLLALPGDLHVSGLLVRNQISSSSIYLPLLRLC